MSNAQLIASALEGLTPFERDEFRFLWQRYLDNVADGEPQLVLPEKVGQKLGIAKLSEIALNYSKNLGVHVRVVHDAELKAYLIGDANELPFGGLGQKRIFDTNNALDPEDSQSFVVDAGGLEDEDMRNLTISTQEYGLYRDDTGVSELVSPNPLSLNDNNSHGQLPWDPSRMIMAVQNTEQATPMEIANMSPKNKEPKLPKPSNSFILYRKFKQPMVLKSNPDLHCSKVSKIIGDMWRAEDPTVKAKFQRQADEEKRLFMEKNPDWKCSPRKSSDIRRRNKSPSKISTAPSDFPLNQDPLTMNANSSFESYAQSTLQLSEPLMPTTKVSKNHKQLHPANLHSNIDTLDVSQTSSELLPIVDSGDLPWSFGVDMDQPGLIDQNWVRTLESIDVNTPDRFISRRNFCLEDAETAQLENIG